MAIDLWKREQFVYEGYTNGDEDRESHSSHESDHQDPQLQQQLQRDEQDPHFYVPSRPPILQQEPVTSSDEVSSSGIL